MSAQMQLEPRPRERIAVRAVAQPTSSSAVTTAPTHAPATEGAAAAGNPADEYKSVCEFLRLYATLRFYRLALLLGTTGSIVTALTSIAVRSSFARLEILKFGGLVVSLAFLVMEFRATSHWLALRKRGNELAQCLCFQPFPGTSRWDPLTTSGAGFYLYAVVAALWAASLLLRVETTH
jgi:hypothetical protein